MRSLKNLVPNLPKRHVKLLNDHSSLKSTDKLLLSRISHPRTPKAQKIKAKLAVQDSKSDHRQVPSADPCSSVLVKNGASVSTVPRKSSSPSTYTSHFVFAPAFFFSHSCQIRGPLNAMQTKIEGEWRKNERMCS